MIISKCWECCFNVKLINGGKSVKKYVSKRKTMILTLACTAALGTGVLSNSMAYADEPQQFTLEEMVVTASRVDTKKVDTPANITVIDQEKLAESNYADAADALRDVPGVNILGSGAKGSNMGQDLIMLNGDKRVLVLIDGRRVNMASSGNYSADWLPPVDAIEKIEVLKGAGSALYGTDAVGGVINIITKKGTDIENKGTVKVATGSWNTEQYSVTYGGSENGLGLFVSANKDRRGDYSYKDNLSGDVKKLVNSGYDTTNTTLKIDKELGNNDRITLQAEHMLAEGGSPFGNSVFVSTDSHQRLNNNIALRYDWNEHKDNSGFAQVYKNYQHAYFYSNIDENKSDFNEDKYGIELQQNWKLDKNHNLTGGLDYYNTKVDNETLYGDAKSVNNKAIYLEDRWKIADSWQLNSGVRYDNHSNYGSEVTPHFALNKKINDASNAYISWGKVFNAPNTDDLYWHQRSSYEYNGSTYYYWMLGDENLKPETGDVLNIGTNIKLSDNTNLVANVFKSVLNDAIDWVRKSTGDYQVINVNSEKRRGMEVSIDHSFDDNWTANASYTYLQVKQDFGTGYLKNGSAKPNVYRAGVKYKNKDLIVNITAHAATGQVASYTNKNGGTTGAFADNAYFTWDLGAQYKINKNAKAFAQFNNINNVAYQEYSGLYDYGDGSVKYPMASRNFVVGMEYSF